MQQFHDMSGAKIKALNLILWVSHVTILTNNSFLKDLISQNLREIRLQPLNFMWKVQIIDFNDFNDK